MITGDLNGETFDFPTLQALISDGSLIDLGLHAAFQGPTAQPTCFPLNNGAPSRRDSAFVSADCLPFVSNFEVIAPSADTMIPVHACLKIEIDFPMTAPTKTVLTRPPLSMTGFLMFSCSNMGLLIPSF